MLWDKVVLASNAIRSRNLIKTSSCSQTMYFDGWNSVHICGRYLFILCVVYT